MSQFCCPQAIRSQRLTAVLEYSYEGMDLSLAASPVSHFEGNSIIVLFGVDFVPGPATTRSKLRFTAAHVYSSR